MFAAQVSSPNSGPVNGSDSYSRTGSVHRNLNVTSIYHVRQQQHQQRPFPLPQNQHGMCSSYQQDTRHFCNLNYTLINNRPPPSSINDACNTMWLMNNGHFQQHSKISEIIQKDVSLNSHNYKDQNSERLNKWTSKTSISSHKSQKKKINLKKKSPLKSENSNKSNTSILNVKRKPFKTTIDISNTKNSDSNPSQLQKHNKDKKQNNNYDTVQRNSSKASHTSLKSPNCKNDNSDSTISTNDHLQYSSNSNGKQRKSRNGNKRQETANNNATQHTNDKKCNGSSGLIANDWFKNDVYCYERRFTSSCGEGNVISHNNTTHRNSTSSEAAGSDDFNSSSSNEDLCSTYLMQTTPTKRTSKSRRKRQQKHKQHSASLNMTSTIQSMDVDEDAKENVKPNVGKHTSTNSALNLRKQCTKAAALKAVLNNSKISKSTLRDVNISASDLLACNSMSSASSTTSINSSPLSSTSSSPSHSASSSPTASPTASKRSTEHYKKSPQSWTPPLRQFTKLNMNEQQLVQQMRRYVIDPSLLRIYGFPVESVHHEGSIEIYKCLPKHMAEEAVTKDNQRHHRHFYGRKKCEIINANDGLHSGSCSQQWYNNNSVDSGHGSGESSPSFTDSDSSEVGEDETISPITAFYTPDGVYHIFSDYCNSTEKQCVRCSKIFQINQDGQYLSFDSCTYHWGKLSNVYNGKCYVNAYSCCQGEEFSEGCSQHPLHVWNGTVVGINGPYTDYVHTKPRETKTHKHPKVYAIDCEMSYTGLGLEVTKVTVVGYNGSLVYEHFVRPQAEIIDYNTRFSGVSEKDLLTDSNNTIKTFSEVQEDLLNMFDADTILIGHGLDNDLRVLRLVHKTIVDTSVIFSHSTGYPYRRSLKNLTKSFLKRDIQCGVMGHSSFEDSQACLELMMWKVRKDLRHWNYQ